MYNVVVFTMYRTRNKTTLKGTGIRMCSFLYNYALSGFGSQKMRATGASNYLRVSVCGKTGDLSGTQSHRGAHVEAEIYGPRSSDVSWRVMGIQYSASTLHNIPCYEIGCCLFACHYTNSSGQ